MSISLVESFRALFKSLDFGKLWMTQKQASVIFTFVGPIPGPEPIARVEYSSIEPASAELVEKVFRELDRPNPDFLD